MNAFGLAVLFSLMLWLVLPPTQARAADTTLDWRDGPEVRFDNGARLRIDGRLQADAVHFDHDVTPLDDREDFRRARLGAQLDWNNWRGVASYDFGVSEGWKNLYVQYRGWDRARLTLGNQVSAFSMEDLGSSNNLPLLERSVATRALAPGMLQGLSFNTWGERWTWRAGIYGNELSSMDRRKMDGTSVMSRVTFAPVVDRNGLLHVGVSAEYRSLDDNTVRLRARPGTRLTSTRLVDTGTIEGEDNALTTGIEFAAAYRNLRLMSEAMHTRLDGNGDDVAFDGQYLTLSMLLGGEKYRYARSSGTFKGIRPRSKIGTFELAARLARVDLDDAAVQGGEQTEYTFGVNWIATEQFKVMLNYTDVTTEPNADGIDEDVQLLSLRLQYAR